MSAEAEISKSAIKATTIPILRLVPTTTHQRGEAMIRVVNRYRYTVSWLTVCSLALFVVGVFAK